MRAVRLGGPTTTTPAPVGPEQSAPSPVVVGIPRGATVLDELRDVDGTAAAPIGVALVKQPDGMFRGQFIEGGESVEWFTGNGPPPALIPGAGPGDIYIDKLTGWLYRLQ